ncbi:E3 ubiquitin-protein ligase RNF144A-like isoform X3 [Telopea speciosissima]|uniref:E3 ubiquitin-protein ligase RNF144A-like isoform X3 n=1 Tax=Telopea speciosissima TaxID=54955 RepID=UPI001CC445F4|nr:E3 ubiquitin-protein ligase RNF144A-like isoform X3 [Telopea speciosissima]
MKKKCESSKERKLGDDDAARPIEIIDIEKPIEIIDIENVPLFTHISLRGRNKKDPILVEQYAEDRELQQAIHTSNLQARSIIDLSEEDELEEIEPNIALRFRKTAFLNPSVTEIEQSSNSNSSMTETGQASSSNDPTVVCEICVELKSQSELFNIKGCTHSYCSECMVKYVASKIQENITLIRCPESNCKGVLEPEFCQSILPPEVFDRWGNALCESLFLGSQKLYCPYKDCSALLLDDGGEVVQESECPNCRRLFCAQCKVPWHSGIYCQDFQKLSENERSREDIMLMMLAKQKKWQRCPKCKAIVERIDGCLYMKCRCTYAFCYNCGSEMTGNSHYCIKCRH